MTGRKKLFIGITISLFIVIIALLIFLHRLITKSFPVEDGSLSVENLKEEVKIYRDGYSIPYINAKNDYDLYFSFGYVVAQERLWQMDLNRRIAKGTLSEIFGEKTLTLDVFSRTIGFDRICKEIEANLNPESRNILQAYADGINCYIENNRRKLPVEFDMLKYEPEKWQVYHSILIMRLFAWEMNFAWWSDLMMGELLQKVGEKKFSDILPSYPSNGITIIHEYNEKIKSTLSSLIETNSQLSSSFGHSNLAGSNSWVISGNKSYTGKPLMANDPHLVLSLPSKWFLVSLHTGNYDITGASIPGIPVILIGYNNNTSWGITNAMVDESDFYLENIDTLGQNKYLYNNTWNELNIIHENILVKSRDTFKLSVYSTANGPIVSQFKDIKGFYEFHEVDLPLKGQNIISGKQISIRWTGSEISDEILGMIKINKAKNVSDFNEGIKHIKSPCLNFIYADNSNNIAYALAGRIPIRKNENSFLPVSGSNYENRWQGFIPENDMPKILNPGEGFLITANNKITDNSVYKISGIWESPSRAERIHEILISKDKFSQQDFEYIQQDVISPNAREIGKILFSTIEKEQSQDYYFNQAITYLRNWDYSISKESIPAAIFNVFLMNLLRNTFQDEMGNDLFERYCFLDFIPTNVITKLLHEEKSSWFDNINTPDKTETRDDIIKKSFTEALEFLKSEIGPQTKDWRWGTIHKLELVHPFGLQKPLDRIFNVGPYETSGSNTTINSGYYDFLKPYKHVVGPSLRCIMDLSNNDESSFVISSGQSGQAFSPHYEDQIILLLNGRYIKMYNNLNSLQNKINTLTLKPVNK
jgi:penicillin G amidase